MAAATTTDAERIAELEREIDGLRYMVNRLARGVIDQRLEWNPRYERNGITGHWVLLAVDVEELDRGRTGRVSDHVG
jgi:hypothetical protein